MSLQYSVMGLQSRASGCIRAQREQLCTLRWTQSAGLGGGMKLEAYHQSRQPKPFSLFPLMFWVFGDARCLVDAAASLSPT